MYSLDLRQRVVEFVQEGGTKAEAARRYRVAPSTVYSWLNRADLKPTLAKRRRRKLDWNALRDHVKQHPDARLVERAAHFGVTISSIHYALKEMKITRKKRTSLP